MATCQAFVKGKGPVPSKQGPTSAPPAARHQRYTDPKLQEVYARIYGALRAKTIAVYGHVFTEEEADWTARQAVDAVGALFSSKEIEQQVACLIEPIAARGARNAVIKLLLGVGITGGLGYVAYRTFRKKR